MNNHPEKIYLYFQGTYFNIKLPDGSNYKPLNELVEFPKSFVKQREIYRKFMNINDQAKRNTFMIDHLSELDMVRLHKPDDMIEDRVLSIDFDSDKEECYVIYFENLINYINQNFKFEDIDNFLHDYPTNIANIQNRQDGSDKTNILNIFIETLVLLYYFFERWDNSSHSFEFLQTVNYFLDQVFLITNSNLLVSLISIPFRGSLLVKSFNNDNSFINILYDLYSGLEQLVKNKIPTFNYNFTIIQRYTLKILTNYEAKKYLSQLKKDIRLSVEREEFKDSFRNDIDYLLKDIYDIEKYESPEQFHFFEKKGNDYYRLEKTKLVDIAKSLSAIQGSNSQSIVTLMENSKRFKNINFESLKTTIKTEGKNPQDTNLTDELRLILKELGILV